MHWHVGRTPAEDTDHVVVECLDGLFCHVLSVIVRWDEFVGHLCKFNFGFVCHRGLIVKDLMPWFNASASHACEGTSPSEDEFTVADVF